MRIFLDDNVLEAARKRIKFLFDEFEVVIVNMSGGKDSTVCYELCLEEAKRRGQKLPVMWIDQEVEWQHTVRYVDKIMHNPDVIPYWFQMPMVITNNASSFNRYNHCWASDEEWVRPQSDISIKVNKYGTDRFHELFGAIMKVEWAGKKACYVAGMRTEEAPKRLLSLTARRSYKDITWAKAYKHGKGSEHYTFYPIYDWSYVDVWKYIYDKGCDYNKVYDYMYRFGVKIPEMRVSNLHHETAIQSLMLVQEIEPETWVKISHRIDGANTIKHIKRNAFTCPKELPPMFKTWKEYAHHLMDNIIQDDKNRQALLETIKYEQLIYTDEKIKEDFWRAVINTILSSDWDFTKFINWRIRGDVAAYRQFKQGRVDPGVLERGQRYLTDEQKGILIKKLDEKYGRKKKGARNGA